MLPPMQSDAADAHVTRWQDHWVLDTPFDPITEAVVIRMQRIIRHLDADVKDAATQSGLELHEYRTLHHLLVSDTPGRATPTALAQAAAVSPAGMTGRLDTMERAGLVRRTPDQTDRRRSRIEVTDLGLEKWRAATRARGDTEDSLLEPLSPTERGQLADLLRQIALQIETP